VTFTRGIRRRPDQQIRPETAVMISAGSAAL